MAAEIASVQLSYTETWTRETTAEVDLADVRQWVAERDETRPALVVVTPAVLAAYLQSEWDNDYEPAWHPIGSALEVKVGMGQLGYEFTGLSVDTAVVASTTVAVDRDVAARRCAVIAWLKAWWADRQRRVATANQWAQSSTVGDLGELTARWLEGELAFHPGGYDVPDPETLHLVPVLAGLNRAGFLTEVSQPGVIEDVDGVEWRQRAAVQGFVDDERVLWSIVAAARVRGLVCIVNTRDGRRSDRDEPVIVTTGAGRPYTQFGGWLPASNIRLTYGSACDRDAVAAVKAAVQVTVIDPVWGRDSVLWPTLAGAVVMDADTFPVVEPCRLSPDPALYVAEWSAPIGPTRLAEYLIGPGESRMTKPVLVARDPDAPYRPVPALPYETSLEGLADQHWWAA